MVTVDISKLSPEAKIEIEKQKIQDKIAQYGEWVGLGKEIGVAVDASLSSITDRASQFANTDMGKVTMAVVVYKIIGRDLFRILFGSVIFVVVMPPFIYMTIKNCAKPSLSRVRYTEDGKTIMERAYGDPIHSDFTIAYGAFLGVFFVVLSMIMFM